MLVPAESWAIGEERWIIPHGGTAGVLPFARKRLVFNARLGYGVRYGWRDLQGFCQADRAERRDFLRRNDVQWVFVKGRDSSSREFYDRFRLCGASLEGLGAAHPPSAHFGDQSLYRIQPPAP